jgi:hypothetical protein
MLLKKSLAAWQTTGFGATFKNEVKQLNPDLLPLQEGLNQSSYAKGDALAINLLGATELADCIQITAGLFYTGIIAGCSCADDPTPVDEINEYCEVRFDIDKQSGEATVTLLQD